MELGVIPTDYELAETSDLEQSSPWRTPNAASLYSCRSFLWRHWKTLRFRVLCLAATASVVLFFLMSMPMLRHQASFVNGAWSKLRTEIGAMHDDPGVNVSYSNESDCCWRSERLKLTGMLLGPTTWSANCYFSSICAREYYVTYHDFRFSGSDIGAFHFYAPGDNTWTDPDRIVKIPLVKAGSTSAGTEVRRGHAGITCASVFTGCTVSLKQKMCSRLCEEGDKSNGSVESSTLQASA
eukprot:TRINITY_DN7659_c1_g1_i1.p1 TRINITY_DN7659_c1_g1~~TRINITY_DN7659_c1_g1_i1.p1  ORF type:complete len:239 (+),score=33.69 TRINITY_DN7659_c1_g1_i1:29-745(+)